MLKLVNEWDKVFPKDESINHQKVTFKNHFGIELAADMYWPKSGSDFPAIAISGPFGAVKEQSSGLYAQEMAKRGFLTIAFDPSFTGESGGEPRYMNSPDINVEDFQAAVDYLSNLDNVDPNKISIIGICGWGGMAIQTACIDTRIKATVAITMYDMSRVTGNGYYDAGNNEESRYQARVAINNQRTLDYKNGNYKLGGGVVDDPTDAPWFVKQYYDYYKTPRGYHSRSLNSNGGWNITAGTSLLNTRLFTYASEIRSAVLIVHGEKAHSLYFGQDAFKLLKGDNKEFLLVKDATHCDLYDGGPNHDKIPFDDIERFINKNI
ncbi:MAG: alpha/beta hydrolase [Bacilli bacterium]|nr:alpha/beta hydrolase [Bacilli bacterium]